MFTSRKQLAAAAAIAVSALAPAAALATGVHSHPILKSSPQMRVVDAHHAKLRFASDRLPRTATGKVDAKVTYADGSRVSNLGPSGTHGEDIVYTATITLRREISDHQKFTVRFRLGDSHTVKRTVTLYSVDQHK
ncbi:MAG: hypothetical protein QOI73_1541 [Solirubrobacteraceae bacterium]|nr:hypothetical protein [Solirubrobacteraceae bacterium]